MTEKPHPLHILEVISTLTNIPMKHLGGGKLYKNLSKERAAIILLANKFGLSSALMSTWLSPKSLHTTYRLTIAQKRANIYVCDLVDKGAEMLRGKGFMDVR